MTRTRYAPSPTGLQHVGNIRTALFAYLFAKSTGGEFILRIEDTDKKREVPEAIDNLNKSLEWLGIEIDEGPNQSGEYGPYKQSQRLEIYKKYAQDLIDRGLAYPDPYTQEEVNKFREEAKANKKPFLFRNHRPNQNEEWDGSKPLRFKIPEFKRFEWTDEVRGDLSAGEEALDDFIIIKADGFPTYNFAHVIDDHEMQITHVLRGEEFISSMPKFLSLQEALGFKRPNFATLPPVLGSNGGKKLSKRDGAKSILEYRDDGYMPEAVINFLASLGWNDGSEQEVFTPSEIIDKFSLDRIQKAGARFDIERLEWLSGKHIRNLTSAELYKKIDDKFWPENAKKYDNNYKIRVLSLIQERLKHFDEINDLTDFFFGEIEISKSKIKKNSQFDIETTKNILEESHSLLETTDFSEEQIEENLRKQASNLEISAGKLFRLLRYVMTGKKVAPGLFETISALGKEEALKRLQNAIKLL